jgi:hypothetical protein
MGKSTIMAEVPKLLSKLLQKEMGYVLIQGPLLTPGDAIGYLMPKHCEDGRIESAYSEPYWFRTVDGRHISEFAGGIIFIDEEDKADTDVKKVIGEAKLSGRLGPHVIPKGGVVWGAGNRSEDRSGSTKELDHLINRRLEVTMTPDLESLIDWMDSNDVSPLTKSFTRQYPDIVLTGKVPEKQGPWCTPRSLVAADKYITLLSNVTGKLPTDPLVVEEITGMIGNAAMQFFSHVKLQLEMPDYKSIIAAPDKAKVPLGKPDALMLICYSVAHQVTVKDADAAITYVNRMPKEFAVVFAKAAVKREPMLVVAPAFTKWASTNSSLMALLQ